jgi:hypothetical protein
MLLQSLQRIVQGDDFVRAHRRHDRDVVDVDPRGISTALLVPPSSRMVNQYSTHHACSHREKLRPMLPAGTPLIHQAEIRLVYEISRL